MFHITMRVDGMYCGHCALELNGVLQDIGAENIKIDTLSGQTSFDSQERPSLSDVANAVRKCKFQPNMVDISEIP